MHQTLTTSTRANTYEHNSLVLQNLTKKFGSQTAVNTVNLTIRRGEFITILGPSGCGKTTLLRLIAGLENTSGGAIYLNGQNITPLPTAKRHCGIVFQSYALFPNLTAAQNIAYGLHKSALTKEERARRVREMLELVDLVPAADKYPAQLSGGMQQRVALARALAIRPSILLLDEPLSALDANVRGHLRTQICRIQRELGLTTIMVTHDQEEALTMADRIVVMKDGLLQQFDTPENLYNQPANTFVAGFIGTMNFIPDWMHLNGQLEHPPFSIQLPNPLENAPRTITLAFRPEAVEILHGEHDHHSIMAEITHLEFRGAIYAVTAHLVDHTGKHYHAIELALQPKQVQRLNLNEGSRLHLHFRADKVHLFNPSTTAKVPTHV